VIENCECKIRTWVQFPYAPQHCYSIVNTIQSVNSERKIMSTKVLLLTSWYFPHKIITWEAAINLIFNDKVDIIASYDEDLRSPSMVMKMPAVLRLRKQFKPSKKGAKFSRINVFTRDDWTCQYCGKRFTMRELTYDHVIPRKHGGRTEWDNIVTACKNCNAKKASLLPDEAGMWPVHQPIRPKSMPFIQPRIHAEDIPPEWEGYIVATPE